MQAQNLKGSLNLAPTIALSMLISLSPAAAPRAFAAGLQDDVDQAATILQRFKEMPEKSIPDHVIKDAKGLAIMTAVKAGFIFSGQAGKGLVIARTERGWSGPSGMGTGGAGFGFQAGIQVTEFVMVLNTDEAVKAFAHRANVKLGADISVAAGPVGRAAGAGVAPLAAVYTYSRNQGLFAGVSLDGTVLVSRNDANKAYYGRAVTPEQILTGQVKPPSGAEKLIVELKKQEGPRLSALTAAPPYLSKNDFEHFAEEFDRAGFRSGLDNSGEQAGFVGGNIAATTPSRSWRPWLDGGRFRPDLNQLDAGRSGCFRLGYRNAHNTVVAADL
jgi:SH3 domain-containing YSC84-like protein 1